MSLHRQGINAGNQQVFDFMQLQTALKIVGVSWTARSPTLAGVQPLATHADWREEKNKRTLQTHTVRTMA